MGRKIQLTGASIIIYRGNQVLLQQRNDNKCWGYHGGQVELGEIVEEAAKREVLEETGLTVHSLKLFGVYSGPDLYHVYTDGNEAYIIDIVYSSDDFSGVIKRQEREVNDLRWFSMAELPENLSPPIRRALHDFIAAQNKQS